MRLQSSLGSVQYGGRNDIDNSGKIVVGTVIKVYEKNNTADILLQSGSFIGDNNSTKGLINAPVQLESYSGYDEETGNYYGDYTPIEVGQRVVLAFIGSEKYKPIIIGSLPTWNQNQTNMNPRMDARGEAEAAIGERIRVNKDQSYSYRNGNGEFEEVESSGAFTVGKIHKMSDHREDGFDFEDLTLKDKRTNKTIRHNLKTSLIVPFNYLRVTKNTMTDEKDTTYTRFFHDAELGITRVSKDKKDFLFSIGIDEKDNFEIRVQPKTFKRLRRDDEPREYDRRTLRKSEEKEMQDYYSKNPRPNVEVPDIIDFTKLSLDKDGNLVIFRQTEKGQTSIGLTDKGIKINSSEDIEINTEQKISINSNNDVAIKTKGKARIDAEKSIDINSDKSININAPKVNITENPYYNNSFLGSIKDIDTKEMRFKDPGVTGTENKGNYEW